MLDTNYTIDNIRHKDNALVRLSYHLLTLFVCCLFSFFKGSVFVLAVVGCILQCSASLNLRLV